MLENPDILVRLKTMNKDEKKQLASEIRERLLSVVPENGGHLASNLGVVELTIGMYSVLDPYKDKIIWDVGHQSYIHKLLTGREETFDTIRTFGGISGFPLRSESEADVFDTGHSSTSISAAVGFARARDLKGDKYRVVAVIGDAAIGGGMAFEALNDAGRTFSNMIVILNDNGMSISQNVGGLSRYLRKIRTRKSYVRLKKGVKNFLVSIPHIGNKLVSKIQRMKSSVRAFVIPGEFFTEIGFKYIGPIDGHDPAQVASAIEKADYLGGPVIIHAITKKGSGYAPAEENPSSYHGVSPREVPGTVKYPSYSSNFGRILCDIAKQHEDVVAVSAAMLTGTGLSDFSKMYPERFFDVGIAEQHAVTMAAGMAASGLRPYVCMYSTFMQRAYDQLLHDVALQNLPVVFVLDRAGISGPDGKTHQGLYDLSFMKTVPGITVCSPSCIPEQESMIRLSYELNKPFCIRYPAKDNSAECVKESSAEPVTEGKGTVIYNSISSEKDGPRVLIVALGQINSNSVAAAEILEEESVSVTVFNARFLVPFDSESVRNLIRLNCYDAVVSAEDGIVTGGLSECVRSVITEMKSAANKNIRFRALGFPNEPVAHGKISQIYKSFGLDGNGIAESIKALLKE